MSSKKIYFASDFHLGVPNYEKSLEREKLIVQWLDEIKKDAQEIFLVGDIFDFWFEYKNTVPRGFVRLLGKLAEIKDAEIPITCFTGNHDMWMFGYFQQELNIPVSHHSIQREFNGKKFFIGHGDGLGPNDYGYKFVKKIFANKICQWIFGWIHPNLGIPLAKYFSKSSREANYEQTKKFLGEEKEWLIIYCKEVLKKQHYDYFIFGHRHLPLDIKLNEKSRYINLGDWIQYNTYAVFDGEKLELKEYKK